MASARPADDTTAAADAAQVDVLRRMGPAGRLRAGLRFSASMIALSRAGVRSRHPGAGDVELRIFWIEENYGPELARAVARKMGVDPWTHEANSPTR